MNPRMPRRGVRYLLALYVLSAFILVISAVISRREYQDSWILEDLFIQTLLLSFTFLIVAVSVRNNTKLVLLIASFLPLLNGIPSMKYVQIHGVYDSIAHYGYVNRLVSSGHVPETGFYANKYAGTPGMHIFLSTIELVTGMHTTLALKLFLAVISSISPFVIYFVTKNVFSEGTRRFLLLALCLLLPVSYSLVGTSFALPLYLIFISVLFRQTLVTQSPKQFAVILVIIGAGLIISHGVTSLFLSLLMCCTLFILKILERVKRDNIASLVSRYVYVSSFLVVSLMAWWAYHARDLFYDFMIGMLKSLFIGRSTTPLPLKLFELSLSEQLVLIFVRFYDTFLILALSLVGLIFYFTTFGKQYSKKTRVLYLQILCILGATVIIALPFFSKLQSYTFERFINYSNVLSPFFIGLSLYGLVRFLRVHMKRPAVRNLSFTLFLFMLAVPLLLVKFPCQPILPKNNENEFIVDYRSVNTVYQMRMIKFAESHYVSGLKIASDSVTSWQIFGLTNTSFSSGYSWLNPLYENNTESDMILLHYSGRSGPLNEKVEYRTRAKLNEFKFTLGNNIVYDNGESFIIAPNNE